ncbi:MAG TPA: LPS export ABC transporter ATP-binding protein, partial [Rhodobiaceae bacterium]|nr:LPS export ABC transporter ATP-binding protein [Rhodobiaceae bacterium]
MTGETGTIGKSEATAGERHGGPHLVAENPGLSVEKIG